MAREWETVVMVNIDYLIRRSRLTLESLSRVTSIPKSTLNRWRTGETKPGPENLLKFCEFFNVTLDDIYKKDIRPIRGKNFVTKKIVGQIKRTPENLPTQKSKSPNRDCFQLGLFCMEE